MEHLNTLNELTPKVRCMGKSVDPTLIFGLDSKLFSDTAQHPPTPIMENGMAQHHDEVETVTLLRGASAPVHKHTDACNHSDPHPHGDHPEESTAAATHNPQAPASSAPSLDEPTLSAALQQLPKESVYRVKGFIRFVITPAEDSNDPGWSWWILNWAFGRWELVRAPRDSSSLPILDGESGGARGEAIQLTVIGERGEVRRPARKLAKALGAVMVA
jgi:hypothetical protein